jgi:DNA invertase Pin-like site-specific DNA recombinase
MKNFIAYYRVSTAKQGLSGLGLEAQQAAVASFVKSQTGNLVAEYVEIESGKHDDRPKLEQAISAAAATGATLVIAKLDRLSRNAGFIFRLRDSGVSFIAADMPEANTLTIGILAVIAQAEREAISARTKAALAARRARGLSLGTPSNLTAAARARGPITRHQKAVSNQQNRQAAELIRLYTKDGVSLRQIAAKLNAAGYKTRNGKQFSAMTVSRLLRLAVA